MKGRNRKATRGRLDVIVPVYNEADALPAFQQDLAHVLGGVDYVWRVIFIDDGSSDSTPRILSEMHASDSRMSWLRLSRNFGYQAALTAGLDAADADVVVTMDGDGEHPPDLIPEMLALHESGYQIVATSRVTEGRPGIRDWPRQAFYRLLNLLAIDLLRHVPATGRQTAVHLTMQAGSAPRPEFARLALAQLKGPVEHFKCCAHGLGRSKGPEIERSVLADLAHHLKPGIVFFHIQAQGRIPLVVPKHHVEMRPVALDKIGL